MMKETIRVKDRMFGLMVPEEEIAAAVAGIARRINSDYAGKEPVFLCVLNGSFIFAADLLRKIDLPCRVSFIKYASYTGTRSTQQIRNLIGLNEDLKGQDVIIVEDIVDTGLTLGHLLEELAHEGLSSLRIAAFCFKKEAFRADFRIDYPGMEIPNEFVVGYGMDYDGFGRNLAGIYKIVK
jgi:hypoxanthine phosphoribosyltransferase